MNFKDVNILLVEDNEKTRKLLSNLLGEMGIYQVFEAGDGRQAQEFLDSASDQVDLIICDWQMPRMTGIELLQQVRTVYRTMPFLMVTGNTDADSVKAARMFGVNAYIAKPFTAEQFEKKVSMLLRQLHTPV